MMLCAEGCPAGLVIGYLAGRVLMPVIMESTSLGTSCVEVSISPVIFAASALFSIVTVFLSCARPARMASKVSPVEAVKYADASHGQHKIGKMRRIRKPGAMKSAGLGRMALANLGRNRLKTLVVILSMALSVVLLSVLCAFVGGFDMEKYLSKQTCA